MITPEIIQLAQTVWDYHHLNHQLQKSDAILVLGSNDTRVAEWSAKLWLDGWAPLLIFSGGLGRLTKEAWTQSEASLFADIAKQNGVPAEAILIEDRSTNTGENILFTKQLLEEKGLFIQKFLLVQKPYMERRSYATFLKQWPGKELCVSSPPISLLDYPTEELPLAKVINIMVGDLQRIRIYAEKGFQVAQEIPHEVWKAYEQLVAMGFDQQLVKKPA
jgi:uncharacterized SAM-binding protein YcdF (DUF218 family)